VEAFGRVIAVLLAAVCIVLFPVHAKIAHAKWQKNETVRSLVKEYVTDVFAEKRITVERRERLVTELERLGKYEINLTLYERRRYEDEDGRIYLYHPWDDAKEEKMLLSGSYLRVTVMEEQSGKVQAFFYGEGGTVVAGGRVP